MGEAKRRREQFRKVPLTCIYCDIRPATMRDHVPPKGLFLPRLRLPPPAVLGDRYRLGVDQARSIGINAGAYTGEPIMAKINENDAAAAALSVTRESRLGDVVSTSNVPDLDMAGAQAGRR